MSDITELNTKVQFDEAVAAGRVVIDFARRHGCVPCQRLEPHYSAASKSPALKNVSFYKVLLDEVEPDLIDHALHNLVVLGTPTIIEFNDGVRVRNIEGRTAPLIVREFTT